jgi:hypothetical protein
LSFYLNKGNKTVTILDIISIFCRILFLFQKVNRLVIFLHGNVSVFNIITYFVVVRHLTFYYKKNTGVVPLYFYIHFYDVCSSDGLGINTARGLLPSYGPTIPLASISSISRAARV